jgi:hypothetical protein
LTLESACRTKEASGSQRQVMKQHLALGYFVALLFFGFRVSGWLFFFVRRPFGLAFS